MKLYSLFLLFINILLLESQPELPPKQNRYKNVLSETPPTIPQKQNRYNRDGAIINNQNPDPSKSINIQSHDTNDETDNESAYSKSKPLGEEQRPIRRNRISSSSSQDLISNPRSSGSINSDKSLSSLRSSVNSDNSLSSYRSSVNSDNSLSSYRSSVNSVNSFSSYRSSGSSFKSSGSSFRSSVASGDTLTGSRFSLNSGSTLTGSRLSLNSGNTLTGSRLSLNSGSTLTGSKTCLASADEDSANEKKKLRNSFSYMIWKSVWNDCQYSSYSQNDFYVYKYFFLKEINLYRSYHKAKPLTMLNSMNKEAQKLSGLFLMNRKFMKKRNSMYGEIYGITLFTKATLLAKEWYDQIKNYNFLTHGISESTKMFTQLVWRSSQTFGIGISEEGGFLYVVCIFNPKGNIKRHYRSNVASRQKKKSVFKN